MKFLFGKLVLLAVLGLCVARTRGVAQCSNDNTYTNNFRLLRELPKHLYAVYSSTHFYDNEVYRFHKEGTNISARTTSDFKCCTTVSITTAVLVGNYFHYHVATDPSCSTKVNQDGALKLLYKNYIDDERCLILWTCRSSRTGVHAWCNRPTVSAQMDAWIKKRFAYLKVVPSPVMQQVDYKNGPCFTQH